MPWALPVKNTPWTVISHARVGAFLEQVLQYTLNLPLSLLFRVEVVDQ
jgi:hypothetical protein